MNQNQYESALSDMTSWLAHPQELGKEPAKIELAKEFDYEEDRKSTRLNSSH